MGATGPGGSLPHVAVLLLLALSGAQAQRSWTKQLPPSNYYRPDIDVTSPFPLPRIPISPYHMQVSFWGVLAEVADCSLTADCEGSFCAISQPISL